MKLIQKQKGIEVKVNEDGRIFVKEVFESVLIDSWWRRLLKDGLTYLYAFAVPFETYNLYLEKDKKSIIIYSVILTVIIILFTKHIFKKLNNQ